MRDLRAALAFYDAVMPLLGYRRAKDVPAEPLYAGAAVEIEYVFTPSWPT